MNLNKTFGRVATTLVAATMLASVSAVPVFAAEIDSDGVVAGDGDVVTIKQKIDMTGAVDASVPSVTFTYSVAANGTLTGADSSVPAYKGITNGVTATTAVFGDDDTKGSDGFVTETFDVDFSGVTWTGVGVYRYKLTYAKDNAAVTVPENDALYLDVYVGNDDEGGYKVLYYVLTSDGSNLNYNEDTGAYNYQSKTDSFTADYDTYSLTVKKYITGDMATLSDEFDFEIEFTNLPAGVQLKKDTTDIEGDDDSSITATLGNEDTVAISGIPALTKDGAPVSYTVSEQFATSKGYNTKYEVNTNVAEWQGTGAEEIEGVDEDGTTTMTSRSQNMSTSATNVIEFNNNKESVTPTGIVMNVAPYVLLVVVAAAGCFVFLRKRRED